MTNNKEEVRRQNLKRLISEHEGTNSLARKLGLVKGAYLSQILATPPVRNISEKTARKWEKLLGLPEGWMDGTPRTSVAAPPVNTVLLSEVVSRLVGGLQAAGVNLSPARLGDLVAMQYADAVTAGHLDRERLDRMIGILKG